MEEIKNEKLEKLLEEAENLEWSYRIYREDSDRTYVELEKYSPAGEDFIMTVDFLEESEIISFFDDLNQSYAYFDVDEHVEMYAPNRGQNGVPGTYRELVEDAEAIKEMIGELYDFLHERHFEMME